MKESNLEIRIKKPIFIFGCSNSGTTILWKSLKSHKDISGPDIECQDLEGLPDSMRHNLGNATFRMWAHHLFAQGDENGVAGSNLLYYATEEDFNEGDMQTLIGTYSNFVEPGKRMIAKSPADTLRARLIQAYFPDAYFVAIVRDGYAVSEGIRRKRWHDPERPQFEGLHTTIEDAAEQWYNANRVISSYKELNLLKRLKVIRYEDLVETPQKVLSSILEFCELDQNELAIPSLETSLNQNQISRLSSHEIETVTRIAQPMLLHFGYEILGRI
jgi:hypothetical protein